MKRTTTRKCKTCKEKFSPRGSNQIVCSAKCAVALQKKQHEKFKKDVAKQDRKDIREMKLKLKTKSAWIKELQVLVNKYVRIRDTGRNCISCNRPLKGKFDAGHFLSTGAYPNLRFNLDNIHGQCVHCNRDKHGNQIEYKYGLEQRIGVTELDELMSIRHEPLKISIPEIEEEKRYFKQIIKNLQ